MKALVILLVAVLFNMGFSQNYYQVISPSVEAELNDVFLINEQIGWIVGNRGIVLKTTNGGINWIRKNTPFQYDF